MTTDDVYDCMMYMRAWAKKLLFILDNSVWIIEAFDAAFKDRVSVKQEEVDQLLTRSLTELGQDQLDVLRKKYEQLVVQSPQLRLFTPPQYSVIRPAADYILRVGGGVSVRKVRG